MMEYKNKKKKLGIPCMCSILVCNIFSLDGISDLTCMKVKQNLDTMELTSEKTPSKEEIFEDNDIGEKISCDIYEVLFIDFQN
jgi:hypothetical protein